MMKYKLVLEIDGSEEPNDGAGIVDDRDVYGIISALRDFGRVVEFVMVEPATSVYPVKLDQY